MNDEYKELRRKIINKMMEIAGHKPRYDDLIKLGKDSTWYEDYTMTPEQETIFKDWFIKTVMQETKMNKKVIEKEYNWFILGWGLKIRKDEES